MNSLWLNLRCVTAVRFGLHGFSTLCDETLPSCGMETQRLDETRGRANNLCWILASCRLTFSDQTPSGPSAHRSERRFPTWTARRKTCCLEKIDIFIYFLKSKIKLQSDISRKQAMSVIRTGGHRTNQDGVELDDWTENVLGVCCCCRVFAVELEDQALVLLLQKDQDVLQEECVEF